MVSSTSFRYFDNLSTTMAFEAKMPPQFNCGVTIRQRMQNTMTIVFHPYIEKIIC
jgi:hypothetical protein